MPKLLIAALLSLCFGAIAQENDTAAEESAAAVERQQKIDERFILLERRIYDENALALRRIEHVEKTIFSSQKHVDRLLLILALTVLILFLFISRNLSVRQKVAENEVKRAVQDADNIMRDIQQTLDRPEMEHLRISHVLRRLMRQLRESSQGLPLANYIEEVRNASNDPYLPVSLYLTARVLVAEYDDNWSIAAQMLEQLREMDTKDLDVLLHLSHVHKNIAARAHGDKEARTRHQRLAYQYYGQFVATMQAEGLITDSEKWQPPTIATPKPPAATPSAKATPATPPPQTAPATPPPQTAPATPPPQTAPAAVPPISDIPAPTAATPPKSVIPSPQPKDTTLPHSSAAASPTAARPAATAAKSTPTTPEPATPAASRPPVTSSRKQPPAASVAKNLPAAPEPVEKVTVVDVTPEKKSSKWKIGSSLLKNITAGKDNTKPLQALQEKSTRVSSAALQLTQKTWSDVRSLFSEKTDEAMPFLPVPSISEVPETADGNSQKMWQEIRQGDLIMTRATQAKSIRERNRLIDSAVISYTQAQAHSSNEILYHNWGLALLAKALHVAEKKRAPLYNASVDKFLAGNVIKPHYFDFHLASLYAIIGNKTECLKWLKISRDSGALDLQSLRQMPDFDSVRNEPWFDEFLTD